MPPYKESDLSQRGSYKFVRVDDTIYVDDAKMQHREIAIAEGILNVMIKARRDDINRVDAGRIDVTDSKIDVFGDSVTLGIKDTPSIRSKTVKILEEESPNHTVIGDRNSNKPSVP